MQHNIATKVLNLSFLQERAWTKVRENQILSFFYRSGSPGCQILTNIYAHFQSILFCFNLAKYLSAHTTDFVSSLLSYFLLQIIKIGSMDLLADDKPNM